MYVGKSTLVKLMVGELEPDQGLIERHPNLRVAYVAQHAFAHIGSSCVQLCFICPLVSI